MTNCFLMLIAATTISQSPAIEPDLEVALGLLGLTSKTAIFDPTFLRMFRQGEFTTALYDATFANPWRVPLFTENLRRELFTTSGKPQETISISARMLGVQTRRSLTGNPNEAAEAASKQSGALDAQLADWKAKGWISGAIPPLDGLPKEVQQSTALLMNVASKSYEFRKLALQGFSDPQSAYKRLTEKSGGDLQGADFDARLGIFARTDLAYLFAGSFDLAAATQEAAIRLSVVPDDEKFDWRVSTRFGDIVVTGGSASKHTGESIAMLLDTGGDDVYVNQPANRSASNWMSVVIDTAGNDKYVSDERLSSTTMEKWEQRATGGGQPGPASAVLGYAFLVDTKGDDLYRSHRPGLGSARAGVAMVLDREGIDVYDSYADSAGFANFGIGFVDDAAGKDQYFGFNQVQGCGQTMGVGLLMDRGGDDIYIANDAVIDFPSAQSSQHNVSMSQGAGNGRRADYTDGHSLAGGIGFLLDADGNDAYSCGVFGQGVGYWEGVGYLYDGGGKDSYSGQWYAQGAAAHFAIGFLDEESGNDSYSSPMNMAQGAGHDFSAGILFDRNGDDQYKAPNLSFGAGNANGIGWFVDWRGNDKYSSAGITLGSAAEAPKSTLRMRALCLGVFMDLGGDDQYPESVSWAKNTNRQPNVKDRGPSPAESQVGVFWDR